MIQDDPILAIWSNTINRAHVFSVMPDGCRDFIINGEQGKPKRFLLSPIMSTPDRVFANKGEMFIGIRLKPGAEISADILGKFPQPDSLESLTELAYAAASISRDASDMMQCLAMAASPATAASDLGVSLRTLQRHTMQKTGRSPDFWRRLARARKAVRCILSGVDLQEAALACHFSDQAHMTRELKSWFSLTPGAVAASQGDKQHPAWSICHCGYDTPLTGEQISTR